MYLGLKVLRNAKPRNARCSLFFLTQVIVWTAVAVTPPAIMCEKGYVAFLAVSLLPGLAFAFPFSVSLCYQVEAEWGRLSVCDCVLIIATLLLGLALWTTIMLAILDLTVSTCASS